MAFDDPKDLLNECSCSPIIIDSAPNLPLATFPILAPLRTPRR